MSEAKEYLMGVKLLDAQINMRLNELDVLKDKLKHITPVLKQDKVDSGGGTQDRMAQTIATIVDMEQAINADIDRYADMKKAAMAMLDKMENPTYMTVLHRRYFLHHSFERIASDMSYSWRWVCKLHGRALQAFDKLLKDNKE
mgnify:CR=1 FL=1